MTKEAGETLEEQNRIHTRRDLWSRVWSDHQRCALLIGNRDAKEKISVLRVLLVIVPPKPTVILGW